MNIVDLVINKQKYIEDLKVGDTVIIIGLSTKKIYGHVPAHPETYFIGAKYHITEKIHDNYPCGSCHTFGHCFRMKDRSVTCGCILGDENGIPLQSKYPHLNKRH